ncbi:MAG: hypothetical protein V3S25_00900 [Nitrospirales bacterium]|jgi:hypothetical protein
MVLLFENDPMDTDDARGHFYHVCQGRVDTQELSVPKPEEPYECPTCGIELETEDFWVAQLKGSV